MAGVSGRSGRRPAPTRLKVVRGNPGKRPLNAKEPQPKTQLSEAPEHLNDEAKREWKRAGEMLADLGVVTELDRSAFAGYCQAWADCKRLTEQLNEMASWTWQSGKGYRQQVPEISMRRECWTRLKEAGSRLGLDPSSRSGLHVEPRSERENKFARLRQLNPFAEFES